MEIVIIVIRVIKVTIAIIVIIAIIGIIVRIIKSAAKERAQGFLPDASFPASLSSCASCLSDFSFTWRIKGLSK